MPPKKAKTPAVMPRPQRATVVIVFANRGASQPTLGFGAQFRRIKELVMREDKEERVDVVGNGTVGIGHAYPLECTLAETGTVIGHLDWNLANDASCQTLAAAVVSSVRKYLSSEYATNTAGKLEPPGKFVGSASFAGSAPAERKKKAKKKK